MTLISSHFKFKKILRNSLLFIATSICWLDSPNSVLARGTLGAEFKDDPDNGVLILGRVVLGGAISEKPYGLSPGNRLAVYFSKPNSDKANPHTNNACLTTSCLAERFSSSNVGDTVYLQQVYSYNNFGAIKPYRLGKFSTNFKLSGVEDLNAFRKTIQKQIEIVKNLNEVGYSVNAKNIVEYVVYKSKAWNFGVTPGDTEINIYSSTFDDKLATECTLISFCRSGYLSFRVFKSKYSNKKFGFGFDSNVVITNPKITKFSIEKPEENVRIVTRNDPRLVDRHYKMNYMGKYFYAIPYPMKNSINKIIINKENMVYSKLIRMNDKYREELVNKAGTICKTTTSTVGLWAPITVGTETNCYPDIDSQYAIMGNKLKNLNLSSSQLLEACNKDLNLSFCQCLSQNMDGRISKKQFDLFLQSPRGFARYLAYLKENTVTRGLVKFKYNHTWVLGKGCQYLM